MVFVDVYGRYNELENYSFHGVYETTNITGGHHIASNEKTQGDTHQMWCLLVNKNNYEVAGWWFQPLWKTWKSVGIISPNIWKNRINVTNQQPNSDIYHKP